MPLHHWQDQRPPPRGWMPQAPPSLPAPTCGALTVASGLCRMNRGHLGCGCTCWPCRLPRGARSGTSLRGQVGGPWSRCRLGSRWLASLGAVMMWSWTRVAAGLRAGAVSGRGHVFCPWRGTPLFVDSAGGGTGGMDFGFLSGSGSRKSPPKILCPLGDCWLASGDCWCPSGMPARGVEWWENGG